MSTTNKSGFFKNLMDNITEGAHLVSDKVSEVSKKAVETGSEFIDETSEKISDFNNKRSLENDLKSLEQTQEELIQRFGAMTLDHYLKKDSLHKSFLTTKKVDSVVEEFKANEKIMLKIEKQIKKLS